MRLRGEASLGIGTVLAVQIVFSVLAIALLSRMGPAIERILEENVYSGEAVEEMLAVLAAPSEDSREAFDGALLRAQQNVTEEAERPVLAVIAARREAALAGDRLARTELVDALRELGQVNRDSMGRADAQAQRLGLAGAWAAALLGALALALGVVVYRRLMLRLELPIAELHRTCVDARKGNLQARCPALQGPHEVVEIGRSLNWLLDQQLLSSPRHARDATRRQADLQRLLVWLVDRQPRPLAVLDATGETVVASQALLGADARDWPREEIPGTELRCAAPPAEGRGAGFDG